MNRNRKDCGVIAENRGCAVAVMHVGVNNHHLFYCAVRLQLSNRHGYIVNRAETLAVAGIRVMKSAAQVRTESVAQRGLPGQNGSACGQPHCFDEFWRIRHFQFHHVAGSECAGFQFAHPVRSVHAQNVFVGRRIWAHKIFLLGESLAEKHFIDEAEFLGWENVRTKIQIVALVIDQFERQHDAWRD